jgi:ABC-type multidrug transport system permease subunit
MTSQAGNTEGKTRIRHPLLELTIVRTKEFGREPEAIFWVFVFPILLALALGFAFRDKPPDKITVGIVEGPAAAQRLAALKTSASLLPSVMKEEDARLALRRGKVSLLVSGSGPVVYRYDPTRPDSRTAKREADDALQRAAGRHDAISSSEQLVHEQGARYIDFLIPGLLGMNLMSTGMWGIAFSVVSARVRKLLKRLIATPMRKSQYLLAQFLSRLAFLLAEVTVLVAFGWIFFGVRVNGSVVTLAIVCVVGGFAFAGVGMLTASRAKTIEAVSGLLNFVMMPMWLCSGVFFSYERFPEAAKPFIRALPLTILTDALRAVINDAVPLAHLLPHLAGLLAWGLVTFVIGLKIFRWQ